MFRVQDVDCKWDKTVLMGFLRNFPVDVLGKTLQRASQCCINLNKSIRIILVITNVANLGKLWHKL